MARTRTLILVDIISQLDTTEDWSIRNTSPMDHPFHLHVWPFRVVTTGNGSEPPNGWKVAGSVRVVCLVHRFETSLAHR